MRVLGLSPGFNTTHWALVAERMNKRELKSLALVIERSGTCRFRDLPAQVGLREPPDHVALPFSTTPRVTAGHVVGATRTVWCCWRNAWPAPRLLTGYEAGRALLGSPDNCDPRRVDREPMRSVLAVRFATLFLQVAEALNEDPPLTIPLRGKTVAAQAAAILLLAERHDTSRRNPDNVTIVPESGAG